MSEPIPFPDRLDALARLEALRTRWRVVVATRIAPPSLVARDCHSGKYRQAQGALVLKILGR